MTGRPSSPAPAPAPAIGWRSRRLWHGLGYLVSAGWMLFVVVWTGNDTDHPLFSWIFLVPLGLWIGGVTVAALVSRLLPSDDPADADSPRDRRPDGP